MKHLFIINPAASGVKNKVRTLKREIEAFFQGHADIRYDTHVTRWARDAMGYVRRYAMEAGELVRVHVCGGSGTLFEAINGAIGLPNVQIAAYPMGASNNFIRYFGEDKEELFNSIHNQVFSGVTAVDAIRCGSIYGISYGLVGLEAVADKIGTDMIEKTGLPVDFCHLWSTLAYIARAPSLAQSYQINLDGQPLDGRYISVFIAGVPCYGRDMYPAVEAHPNDGQLEIYLVSDMPKRKLFTTIPAYIHGNYKKYPERISHYSGKRITLSSESLICMSVDGEAFYEHVIEHEVIPYAVDFVCPDSIDVAKLPRIYNRPEEGSANDR